jgi:hypothetical protein
MRGLAPVVMNVARLSPHRIQGMGDLIYDTLNVPHLPFKTLNRLLLVLQKLTYIVIISDTDWCLTGHALDREHLVGGALRANFLHLEGRTFTLSALS